jgi:hypothetical protein
MARNMGIGGYTVRELTNEEQRVKVVMESMFVPALHDVLRITNPTEYDKWQGNACRQTAVFGTCFLRLVLPTYTWIAWDGVFDDIVHDKEVTYNHAWITGRNPVGNIRLLVDLSRQHHERLFIPVSTNAYPKDHPEYINMKVRERNVINVEECMKEDEYYTKLPSLKVYDLIIDRMYHYR